MEGTTKPGCGFVVFFYRERCYTGEKIVLRAQKREQYLFCRKLRSKRRRAKMIAKQPHRRRFCRTGDGGL